MSQRTKTSHYIARGVNWRVFWLLFCLNIFIALIFSAVLFVYRTELSGVAVYDIPKYLINMDNEVWHFLWSEFVFQLPLFANFMVPLGILELIFFMGFAGGSYRSAERRMWPFNALAKAADDVRRDPLHARLPVFGTAYEPTELARVINGVLDDASEIHVSYGHQARFVADASHELRTPIAVIQGYVNMLGRWAKDDPNALQESIDAIRNEADGMQQLIEQLLFLSRGENGAIPIQNVPVNAGEIMREVCHEAMMIDGEHVYRADIAESCYISGDLGLLKQAVRVLVDNSRKYTPASGEIVLSCKSENGKVRLSVEDTGMGIGQADVPRIFDRFFRADESRTRKTGGSGLGLSIAKWIIDRHYGIIEVLSRKGLGTRVTYVLPQCAAPAPVPAATAL